jgi:pSer/pThr/pTyr-binding forkhead associated (FHA) protein
MLLRLVSSNSDGEPLGLVETPVAIGRGGHAGIPLNDIWVSRRHCELAESDGKVIIRDLNSRHGTLRNGQRVAEAVLSVGDEITVGLTTFVVWWNDAIAMDGRDFRDVARVDESRSEVTGALQRCGRIVGRITSPSDVGRIGNATHATSDECSSQGA